jgi:hypothetical protein
MQAREHHTMTFKLAAASLGVLLLALPLHAATTVFHYRVSDTDEAGLPTIPSVDGPSGIAGPEVSLNADIPSVGVPAGAGNRSIDGGGIDGVVSADIRELDNTLVAEQGGFTYETWFKWLGAGDINSIIDYSGTEKLVIDVNVGAGTELRMRINSDPPLDSFIAEVEPDQWYYTAVVFDTQGNEVAADASITGIFRLYLDGELVDTTDEVTITEFGDSLNRSIGISQHPLAFARDFFDGLVYEPRTSLGALTPAEFLYQTGGGVTGDFDGSGVLDAADIDDLTTQAAGGLNPASHDLNGDALVDVADIDVWMVSLFKSWSGDANLDGEFNSSDLVAVLASGTYEADVASVWTSGDFNGDGRTNSSDLVAALSGGGYESGPRAAAAAVPEPAVSLLWTLGLLGLLLRRRMTPACDR